MQKRNRKIVKEIMNNTMERVSSRQNRTDVHRNPSRQLQYAHMNPSRQLQYAQHWCIYEPIETVAACTGPTQVQTRWGISIEMRKWIQSFIPSWEIISICNLLAKKKIVFYSGVCIKTPLKERPMPRSKSATENKLSSISGDFLSHIILSGHFFILMIFLIVYYGL